MKRFVFLCLGLVLFSSCASWREERAFRKEFGLNVPRKTTEIVFTDEEIVLDGKLDDPAWAKATAYEMQHTFVLEMNAKRCPKVLATRQGIYFQESVVRFLRTKDTLYLGVQMKDKDVHNFAKDGDILLFRTGDTVELFIKSETSSRYWELYATPTGHVANLQYEARNFSRSNLNDIIEGYRTAATVQGTVNDCSDTDEGWCVEIAVPIKAIEEYFGVPFDASGKWTIFASRYDYYYGQEDLMLTSYPRMPMANWHAYEYWARVLFK